MVKSTNLFIKNTSKNEYHAIDSFKFISAILVIIIHVSPFKVFGWEINFIFTDIVARIAVPFFFMCTGFLVFKKIDKNNIDYSIITKFSLNILKLYLIWTLIYSPLKLNYIFSSGKDLKIIFLTWLKEFLLSGSYAHLWYLRALLVGLVLITILLKLGMRFKWMLLFSSGLFFIGLFEDSYMKIIDHFGNVPNCLITFINNIDDFFITTRNGCCFAFLFLVLGMIFAWYPIKISINKSVILFVVSFIIMSTEAVFDVYFNLQQNYDKYLFMPITMFFLFIIVLNIDFKSSRIQKSNIFIKLRKLSAWIYFGHIWWFKIVQYIYINSLHIEENAVLNFILTLTFSLLSSIVLLALSKHKKFKWLNKLI